MGNCSNIAEKKICKNGIYQINYKNGNFYEGQLDDSGYPHGQGKMIYSNGDVYEGKWHHNCRLHGTMKYNDGIEYTGKFRYGGVRGVGVVKFLDGGVYEGDHKNGHRHGYGIYKYANGDVYEGEWHKNKKHGNGKLCYKKPDKNDIKAKVGTWKNGQLDGEVTLVAANGELIKRMYIFGKMIGQTKATQQPKSISQNINTDLEANKRIGQQIEGY